MSRSHILYRSLCVACLADGALHAQRFNKPRQLPVEAFHDLFLLRASGRGSLFHKRSYHDIHLEEEVASYVSLLFHFCDGTSLRTFCLRMKRSSTSMPSTSIIEVAQFASILHSNDTVFTSRSLFSCHVRCGSPGKMNLHTACILRRIYPGFQAVIVSTFRRHSDCSS